jgi:hypothetical protein
MTLTEEIICSDTLKVTGDEGSKNQYISINNDALGFYKTEIGAEGKV